MEKNLDDLPPSYTNLGFDAEQTAGPSAPKDSEAEDLEEGITSPPPAPSAPIFEAQDGGPRPLEYNPPTLVFEDIYDACVYYVKKHCCYGSRFINQMKLTEISNKGIYHYRLESFGENRATTTMHVPYKGGPVDGIENGPPPNVWDMVVRPTEMFKDEKAKAVIPHTSFVYQCRKCSGRGKVTCSSCSGRGREICWSCSGSGRKDGSSCTSCSGRGNKTCWSCSGSGKRTCSKCDGYGKMKSCEVLIVRWMQQLTISLEQMQNVLLGKNHVTHWVSDAGNLPDDKIIKAEGNELLRQQGPQLRPISNAPEVTTNEASATSLNAHRISFPKERIIHQRHVLRAIPYTRVTYQWKNKDGEFFVYGTDKAVYFEDYPQPCCCCTCC